MLLNNKGQAGVYWKIILYIIAISFLFWGIIYITGLREKSIDIIKQFFGFFT